MTRNVKADRRAAAVGRRLMRPDRHALVLADAAGDQGVAERQGELRGVDADVEASSETAEAVNAGHRHRRPEGHGEHCQQCEAGQRATLGVGMIAVEATAVGALPPR